MASFVLHMLTFPSDLVTKRSSSAAGALATVPDQKSYRTRQILSKVKPEMHVKTQTEVAYSMLEHYVQLNSSKQICLHV